MFRRTTLALAALATLTLVAACASTAGNDASPVALVSDVDLPRFMGDWYVIASIPTPIEKGAHNAKESYVLAPDGTIPTTFTFNADAFDGPQKHYGSKAFVLDPRTKAVWGEQYVWPFKADYRISYLSPDYSQVVVTRARRDYVWIMARTPSIPEADLQRLSAFVASQGYDAGKLQRVPQQPLQARVQ